MKPMLIRMAVAGSLLLAAGAAGAQEKKIEWVPGTTPMPNELLKQYPCHSVEEACYNIPAPDVQVVSFKPPLNGDAERGSKIANNIRWGNCFACHSLPGGVSGGTVGPDLSKYGAQEPPLDYVYQRIWDTRAFNPDAHMPIYGTNRVLADQDIRDVMAYLMTGK
ncbi:MAG TPA: sulfur oxidation c-type cytochrome SoxX [Azospirillum sp.]|nr:sulfur oxidation c-type cytochrome SoxX [Azospirillum sp.]